MMFRMCLMIICSQFVWVMMKQAKKKQKALARSSWSVTSGRYRFSYFWCRCVRRGVAGLRVGALHVRPGSDRASRKETLFPFCRFPYFGVGRTLTVDGASVDMTGEVQSEHEHEWTVCKTFPISVRRPLILCRLHSVQATALSCQRPLFCGVSWAVWYNALWMKDKWNSARLLHSMHWHSLLVPHETHDKQLNSVLKV